MKKKLWLSLIVLLVLFFTACANSPNGGYYEDSNSGNNGIVVETSRKVYYTVNIDLECKDISESIEQLNSKTAEYNGYIYNSYINERFAIVTYRIPAEKLEQFLDVIGSNENSEMVEKNIRATDVTSTYNQVEARLEVLKASRQAYLNLLEQTSNMSDIITINTRIEEIDSEILRLENEKSTYDNLVEYSTVTIEFNSKEGNHFFSDYGDYLVGLFKVIGIIILYLLPFAIMGGALIIVIVFISKKKLKKQNDLKKEE